MKPAQIVAAVVLLLVTAAAIAWLPRTEAWELLGSIAGGAAKAAFGA